MVSLMPNNARRTALVTSLCVRCWKRERTSGKRHSLKPPLLLSSRNGSSCVTCFEARAGIFLCRKAENACSEGL